MELKVVGRHMGITEALKQYCREKTERLPRLLDRIQTVEVIVDGREGVHNVEIIVHSAGTQPFVATERNTDAFAAFDLVLDKIEEQLRRHKERTRNRKHPPHGPEETDQS